MTENEIEIKVERAIDRLDRQYMAGKMGELEYNTRIKAIRDWADNESKLAERARLLRNYYAQSDVACIGNGLYVRTR